MKTRKILLLFLALTMLITICSCKRKDPSQTETTTATPETTTTVSEVVTTTTEPAVTTTEPVETTTKPVETTTKPVETTTKPVETTTKPVETTTAPVETTTAPVETTTTPAETTSPDPVDPVEPHTHTYTNWKTTKKATCTSSGKKVGTCSCGATTTRSISAKGHDFDKEIVTKQPTCTEVGSKNLFCSDCDHVETVVVPSTGHTEEKIPGKAAGCTEDGLTDGMKCSVCGETLVAQQPIPAAHTPEIIPAVPATCAATGLTEGSRCSVCEKILVAQEQTEKTQDHTFVNYRTHKEPTCTGNGLEVAECEICHAATDIREKANSALGHVHDNTWDWNSTQHYRICTSCGVSFDAVDHDDAETCLCGYQKPAEPCQHDLTIIAAKAASCTEEGNNAYFVCSKCFAWLDMDKNVTTVKDVMIPATGHVNKLTVAEAKAATCAEDGVTAHVVCKDCGHDLVKPEKISKDTVEHTVVIDEAIPATCTEDGKTAGKHCEVCSTVLVAQEIVPALGHDYTVTTTDPTCTEAGSIVSDCKNCDDLIETAIPATGHKIADDAEWTIVTENGEPVLEPDANEKCLYHGKQYTVCATPGCGYEIEGTYQIVQHNPKVTVTPATCQTEEQKVYECECGVINTYIGEKDPNAHSWSDPVENKSTCQVEGCTASKIVVDNTQSSTAGLNKDTLSGAKDNDLEVNLQDATIKMDSTIVNDLGADGKDVELSADKLDDVKREEATSKLDPEIKEKIQDVYDFNLTVGETKVEFNGNMVVTLPYTLPEGQEPDHVVIAYIDDDGNLELIPVTYFEKDGVGYVTFVTDHFSTFAPIVVSGADLCQVYGHKDVEDTVHATCLTAGYTNLRCTVCKRVELKEGSVVEATGHKYTDTVTPATCKAQGYTTHVCSVCDYTVIDSYTPIADHAMETVSVVSATCTEEGYTTVKCAVCEYTKKIDVVPALGHEFGADVVTKEATCKEQGTLTATCIHEGCSATRETVIPVKAHTVQATEAKAPTCTEDGYTKGYVCAECGETLLEATVIPATEHIEVAIPAIAPTCTQVGATEGVKCAACRLVITAPTEIEKLPHIEVEFGKVEPTCTEPGYESGIKCSECGTVLSAAKEIAALGHKEVTVPAVAPTCTKDGLTEGMKCTVCGEFTTAQEVVKAPGHSSTTPIPAVAPTCTATGLSEGAKCTVCGEVTVEQIVVPMVDHTKEIVPGKDATCTETGLSEGTKCSVCGKVLVEQTITPMIDHAEEVVPGKAPTATEPGLTDGKKCSVCGKILVEQEEIPATDTPDVSDKFTIVADDAIVADGIASVDVSIKNNPGILGMTLIVSYDDNAMELIDIVQGEALSKQFDLTLPGVFGNGCRFLLDGVKPSYDNGTFVTLTFAIKDNAPAGKYDVSLQTYGGVTGSDPLVSVPVEIRNGTVTVEQGAVEEGNLIYAETFDRADSTDTEAILNALGWNQLTIERDGAANESNARFEIKDGKLYFINYADDIAGKDSYYEIASLSGEFMKDIFAETYTLQYDVTYSDFSKENRYVNFITEYVPGGRYYNTAHFRVNGIGNNQCWYSGEWLDYEVADENNLYAELENEDNEWGCSSICMKLLGKPVNVEEATFKDITVTVRVVYDSVNGPKIYLKTADQDEFIQVSQYNENSEVGMLENRVDWEGTMVAFKIGAKVNGWIDNVYLWQGAGEVPTVHEHNWSDWTVVSKANCLYKGVEQRTCSDCDMIESRLTDALGHTFGDDSVCDTCTAKKYSEGLVYTLQSDYESYLLSGIGTCTDTEVIIPAVLPNGRKIIKINAKVFAKNTALTKISIPDTVEWIAEAAFDGCDNLIFNEDENGTYLGNEENPYLVLMKVKDTALTSFDFHDDTKIIWNGAFKGCTNLVSMDIPEGITQIQRYAFQNCTALESVTISSTVTSLSIWMFAGDNNLTTLTVAEGNPVYHSVDNCIITTKTKTLFAGIKTSVIPAGGEEVTVIGGNAFYSVPLTTIYIPEGITQIDGNAFQSCFNLETVIMDATVTKIADKAFRVCRKLTSIFYTGSAEDWTKIDIGSTNPELLGAKVYYYSETEPTEVGNYWHYVDGAPVMWKVEKPAQPVQEGVLVYEQNFDYDNNSEPQAVLDLLGWTKLTKEANGVYNETDAEFAIIDGRLYYDNYDAEGLPEGDTRVRGKDGYYSINALNDVVMRSVVEGKYTLQYDLEYIDSIAVQRYATIITECSPNGQRYNSFMFRIGGYGNNQCHYDGKWKTHDKFDPATDLFANSTATDAEIAKTKGTPISFKLIGEYYDSKDIHKFANVKLTIKVQWEPGVGHHVYMKTADMADFVKVSEPNVNADGMYYLGWNGWSVQFKLGAAIDGFIDNIALWTGWGEKPTEACNHVPGEMKLVSTKSCETHGISEQCCTLCGLTLDGTIDWAPGHKVEEWTVIKQPTCLEEGVEQGVCVTCGEIMTNGIPVIVHSYTDWTQITAPTCTSVGVETASCIYGCGATKTREIAMLDHDFTKGNCAICGREPYSQGLAYKLSTDGSYYSVTGIDTCTDTDIYIPEFVEGIPVRTIAGKAFYDNSHITKIVIPDGVKTIEGNAIWNCSALTTLVLPETLTTIASNGIGNCAKLNYTVTEDGCKYLGTATNEYFILMDVQDNLAIEITIHPDTTMIYSSAFSKCTKMTSVSIPENVWYIGFFAFRDCDSLVSIAIPEGVKRIENFVFVDCDSLKNVTLPSSATYMGHDFFSGCPSVEKVTVHADNPNYFSAGNCIIKKSNGTLMSGCVSSVIPKDGSVLRINNCAFQEVPITYVVIPEGVASIGSNAFNKCQLTKIVIPATVTSISNGAFNNNTSLTTVVYNGTAEQWAAISIGSNNTVLTEANIVFDSAEESLAYKELADGTLAVSGIGTVTATDIEIPAEVNGKAVTQIASKAFYKNPKITAVKIPDSVVYISGGAFNACSKLTDVSFGNGLIEIGSQAFYSTAIQEAILPETVEKIGDQAFFRCNELQFVYIPKSVQTIGAEAFGRTARLDEFVVEEGNPAYKFVDGCLISINDKTLICGTSEAVIPTDGSVETIAKYAFGDVDHLDVLYIPDSIKTIETFAFIFCEYLTEVEIPASVTYIAQDAFRGCYQLTDFTVDPKNTKYHVAGNALIETETKTMIRGTATTVIPADGSVTTIGKDAFYGVEDLTSLNIPNAITTLGQYAIAYCGDLTTVVLPDGLTEIPAYLCRSNAAMATITIPASVTSIGDNAFNGCIALTTVNYRGTEEQWAAITVGTNNAFLTDAKINYNYGASESLAYTELDDGTLAVKGIGTVTATDIVIPAMVDGKAVTQIAEGAFLNKESLTSITIPDSVTIIGDEAFSGCTMLTYVTLSNRLVSIGVGAFSDCAMSSIVLPETLTTIGQNAFMDCRSLTAITIPKSVTSIGRSPFMRCYNLATITVADENTAYSDAGNGLIDIASRTLIAVTPTTVIPTDGTVTVIGTSVYNSMKHLTELTIPEGITEIASSALYGCTSLTKLHIPASVTFIERTALWNVSNLTTITVAAGNPNYCVIGGSLVDKNTKALIVGTTSTVIPTDGSVTSIADFAFYGREDLDTLVIPEGITSIGFRSFEKCTGLATIDIPASLTQIGKNAFVKCSALATVNYGGTAEQWAAISIGSNNVPLTSAKIIYNGTPVAESLAYTELADGTLAVSGIGTVTSTEIVIPAEVNGKAVTQIADEAFLKKTKITSVTIPDSVHTVGFNAFYGCSKLTDLTLSKQLVVIGKGAFSHCAMTEIELPETLTTIGTGAFDTCRNLVSVTIPKSVTSIGEYPFMRCYALTTITVADENTTYSDVGNGLIDIANKTLIAVTPTTEIPTDGSVTVIGTFVYNNMSSLTELVIPEGITEIANSAFNQCTGLTSLHIPASVTTIERTALWNVSNLTTITVAEGNPNYCVLNGCLIDKNAKSLIIGTASCTIPADGSVTQIADFAFCGRDDLTTFVVPEGITSIGFRTFESCKGLTAIDIPASVAEIGNNAFGSCSSLVTVNYGGTAEQWAAITIGSNNSWLTDATINYSATIAE